MREGGGKGLVQTPQKGRFKGAEHWRQNKYFKLKKKDFLALNFKLLAQMTGDLITDSHVLKVINSAMESHSDYSLREPRTSCTAVSNWVTSASCNTVSISWFTEPNVTLTVWDIGSANKQTKNAHFYILFRNISLA